MDAVGGGCLCFYIYKDISSLCITVNNCSLVLQSVHSVYSRYTRGRNIKVIYAMNFKIVGNHILFVLQLFFVDFLQYLQSSEEVPS